MLDCENRINAARYFLGKARDHSLSESEHIWYAQATVIFAVAALAILSSDYRRETQKPRRQTDFYDWLKRKQSEPGTDGGRYRALKQERNLIVHEGEPAKRHVKLEIRQPMGSARSSWTLARYFVKWPDQSVDQACQSLIDWVDALIHEARRRYQELAS
jgi:hypothetical protein